MKPVWKVVLGMLACALLAFGAYQLAYGMMDSIYAFRSPLHETPPAPGVDLGEPMARQVVFVLVDGLRYDTSLKTDVMPVLNNLREIGVQARMHSQTPSYSTPGYSVLLTGAWPYLSDGPAFNMDYEDIPVLSQDNLFSAAKRAGLGTAASTFNWFEKLIPGEALDAGFFTAGEDRYADEEVLAAALPWLGKSEYNLVLIHLDQVDYAGHHEGGPQNPNWDAAANRVDTLLAQVLNRLDLEKDIIFVCSDHGHVDMGGHGGQDAITLLEPFVLAGKGIRPGDYGDVNMVDVAPTLAALLGANIPASAQGRVLTEMFSDKIADLPLVTANQQVNLLTAYNKAASLDIPTEVMVADPDKTVAEYQQILVSGINSQLLRERIPRILVVLVVLGLLIYALWRWRTPQTGWFLLGGLGFTLLFHLAYTLVGGKLYSYSIVASEMALIIANGLATLLSMLLVWVLFYWRLGWHKIGKSKAAWNSLQLVLITIGLTMLPFLVHFAWNGVLVGWYLPVLGLHFLALLSLIQVLFLGISGLVTASLAAVITKKQVST